MRRSNRQVRDKGLRENDPFLSHLLGNDRKEKYALDSMSLHTEVWSIQLALFPFNSESGCFSIECDDEVIKKDLEAYFTETYSRFRDGLYGQGDSMGFFLQYIARQLLVTGASFRTITWAEIEINNVKYILPEDFGYIASETMQSRYKEGKIDRYIQRYSWWTYLTKKRFKGYDGVIKPRKTFFENSEVFHCSYPFSRTTPVEASIRYIKALRKFWRFGLAQAQSGAEADNFSLPLEKSRYTTFAKEKRKYDLARARIRTNFNYPMEANGPRMTQYYDLFTVIRYKKYLNDLRSYLLEEFNEQVMKAVAVKNSLSCIPRIALGGFLTNAELDESLKAYVDGSLNFEEIVDRIIRAS